ncbi:MAG: efflux transporter periplasmic adaptor subunit, partial [Rhodocyclaceae bacterium]|nr:efflux transporter periplasmic adaptor subunit [Rhodocyclaceae bacterium]
MTRGRFGLLILGLLVAAGLIYGFMPRPVPVDAFTTVKGPLAVTVEEEAKTRVMERYVVSAPMSGYLRRIDLKVGDAVTRDQVLAVLEPVRADALDARSRAQATSQVSAAEASLAAARENARAAGAADKLAQQELLRIESLTAARFLSAQAVDQARSNASRSQAVQQAAEHAVNVARFQLDTARVALTGTASLQSGAKAETLSVHAPIQARVLKLLRESEGTVRAGEPLLEVGNPETLEIAAEVLSNAAVRIAPG